MTIGKRQIFLLVLVLIFLCTGLFYWSAFSPVTPPANSSINIKPGSSLIAIANQLAAQKIIRSTLMFRLLARSQNLETAVQAGNYSFSAADNANQILSRLAAGDVDQINITIPEGFNLQQIALRLAEIGVADASEVLTLARDPEFLRQHGIAASSLEGYLFPETYRFAPGISLNKLLEMMINETDRKLLKLGRNLKKKTELNRHQLLTLASIIQKETGLNDEMPLISAVFHNRLERRIPLQTDPTVIYGITNFNGNLTRKDLKRPSPYNTYLNQGLPPGPIASPGFQALKAAAQPAKSDLLYFVARGDGGHQFSKTLREHNRAVRKFQLHRRR